MRLHTTALILAAGRGERFGGVKPAARWHGVSLVAHVVAAARTAGLDDIVVVTGHEAATVVSSVPPSPGVRFAHNPRYASGQASSVVSGLSSLSAEDGIDQAVILLADQPTIDPAVITRVVDVASGFASCARAQAELFDGLRVRYADGAGHPVLLPRRTWVRLRTSLKGDEGVRQMAAQMRWREVSVAGHRPPDVDHRRDLAGLGSDPRE